MKGMWGGLQLLGQLVLDLLIFLYLVMTFV